MQIREALTFDDVLLVPAQSSVLPSDVDTRTQVTKEITLNIHSSEDGSFLTFIGN